MLKKYYDEYKIRELDRKIAYMLILMISIIPIVTSRYTDISYSPVYLTNSYKTGYYTDLFNFYKTIALYIGTLIIFSIFLYKIIKFKLEIRKSKFNAVIIILIVGILGSIIFAQYKDIALFGSNIRNEGALSWLCCIIIFFVLYNINIEEKYYKYFYFSLYPFLLINAFTSIATDIYGKELISNRFVHFLIGGNGMIKGQMETTLYNQNFASGVCALIFCVGFMYLLLETDVKLKIVILLGVILSFISTICMTSNSGFFTMTILIPCIISIGLRFRSKRSVALWTLISIIANYPIFCLLNNKNGRIYIESFGLIEKINSISKLIIPLLVIIFSIFILLMKYTNRKRLFAITSIFITIFTIALICFWGYFLNKEEGKLKESNIENTVRIQDNEIFKKMDAMSTGRIYIWNKTLGLIKEKPIFGYGLDTFPYEFIPNDVDGGKIGKDGTQIDKPHNWYLSIAYGAGIVALTGVMAVIFTVVKQAFYSVDDKIDDKYKYIFAIGVIGYAIQGIFNDSFPGTLLIFWIMAGLSLSIAQNNKAE